MNHQTILEKWADYLMEHPGELDKVCDRIYALWTEDLWHQRDRQGQWSHRL